MSIKEPIINLFKAIRFRTANIFGIIKKISVQPESQNFSKNVGHAPVWDDPLPIFIKKKLYHCIHDLRIRLHSIDGRRLRGQHTDIFKCKLWYASDRRELFVYGQRDNSESRLPIGIIDLKYSKNILPFLSQTDPYVDYEALYDKDTEILSLRLLKADKEQVLKIEETKTKNQIDRGELLQAEYEKKMQRPHKMKKDVQLYMGTVLPIKHRRKRNLQDVTIEFYEKSKYLNRHFVKAKLLISGEYLGEIHLKESVIRTYFSGHELVVKSCRIERDKIIYNNEISLIPTIGLK